MGCRCRSPQGVWGHPPPLALPPPRYPWRRGAAGKQVALEDLPSARYAMAASATKRTWAAEWAIRFTSSSWAPNRLPLGGAHRVEDAHDGGLRGTRAPSPGSGSVAVAVRDAWRPTHRVPQEAEAALPVEPSLAGVVAVRRPPGSRPRRAVMAPAPGYSRSAGAESSGRSGPCRNLQSMLATPTPMMIPAAPQVRSPTEAWREGSKSCPASAATKSNPATTTLTQGDFIHRAAWIRPAATAMATPVRIVATTPPWSSHAPNQVGNKGSWPSLESGIQDSTSTRPAAAAARHWMSL